MKDYEGLCAIFAVQPLSILSIILKWGYRKQFACILINYIRVVQRMYNPCCRPSEFMYVVNFSLFGISMTGLSSSDTRMPQVTCLEASYARCIVNILFFKWTILEIYPHC